MYAINEKLTFSYPIERVNREAENQLLGALDSHFEYRYCEFEPSS